MNGIPVELINEFQTGAQERLETLSRCLMALEENPSSTAAVDELLREAHTIKGESRMLGLEALSHLVHRFEDLLIDAKEKGFRDQIHFDAAFSGIDLIQQALSGPLSETLPPPTQAICDQFIAAIDDILRSSGGAHSDDAPAEAAGPVASAEQLQSFQAGAHQRLATLGRCLMVLEETPSDAGASEEALREIHTLKGELRVLGLTEAHAVCVQVERLLRTNSAQQFADQTLLDASYSGLDFLGAMLGGDLTQPVADSLIAAMDQFTAAISPLLPGEEAPPPVAEASPEPAAPAPTPAPAPAVAAPEPAPAPEHPAPNAKNADNGARREFLSVPADRLEQLVHLSGELMLSQTQQERLVADMQRLVQDWRSSINTYTEARQLAPDIAEKLIALARELSARISDLHEDGFQTGLRLSELQNSISGMQLVEVRTAFSKYPRAVRSMAKEMGKSCAVVLEGVEVAVDKKVLVQIEAALLHLVRNSVDHGIEAPDVRRARGKPEKGTLTLRARNKGAFVEIEISDDGGGIDARKIGERMISKGLATADAVAAMSDDHLIQQIFAPGFSTVEKVTDISGRGVGMDVVKRQIGALGGSLRIHTALGEGTRFVLSLPVSASVSQAMVFRLDQGLYAMPSAMIESMLHVLPSAVKQIGRQTMLQHNDDLIALYELSELLGYGSQPSAEPFWRVVVVVVGETRVGLRIKVVLGERKLIQQACDPFLDGLSLLSGTARIEGGELVSVLNLASLLQKATNGSVSLSASAGAGSAAASGAEPAAPSGPPTILIVEDSDITRRMLVSAVGKLGYRIIEAVNGRDGLDKFNEHQPALVMTDLDMPVMNGLELIEALRGQGTRCPLVVMTTRETPESKAAALQAGANAYLLKSSHNHNTLSQTFSSLLNVPHGQVA